MTTFLVCTAAILIKKVVSSCCCTAVVAVTFVCLYPVSLNKAELIRIQFSFVSIFY